MPRCGATLPATATLAQVVQLLSEYRYHRLAQDPIINSAQADIAPKEKHQQGAQRGILSDGSCDRN